MATTTGQFQRDEARAAHARWAEVTGLDPRGVEFAQVWRVLSVAGLLAADTPAEPELELFDLPESYRAARDSRLQELLTALVAGAAYWRASHHQYDLPTSTAIVATLLKMHYRVAAWCTKPAEVLGKDLADRVLRLFPNPGSALQWRMDLAVGSVSGAAAHTIRTGELGVLIAEAASHEDTALRFFARLAGDRDRHITIDRLCTGEGWVVYRTT